MKTTSTTKIIKTNLGKKKTETMRVKKFSDFARDTDIWRRAR